jgi:hypothetical protein
MGRITILELHGDLTIGPKSFGFDAEDDPTTADRSPTGSESTTDGGSGGAGIALLVGLVFLAILGLAVKRRRGDASEAAVEQPVELAESDEL